MIVWTKMRMMRFDMWSTPTSTRSNWTRSRCAMQLSTILYWMPMVPEVGTYVWYSHNQQPYLGQVVSIDPSVSRPVVVQRFRPQANAESLPRAKFQRAVDPDTGKAILSHLTLPQVQLQFDSLTARGYLSAKDRRKLQDRLTM